jgi:hypothetical protein
MSLSHLAHAFQKLEIACEKRDGLHKLAQANSTFSHYRWPFIIIFTRLGFQYLWCMLSSDPASRPKAIEDPQHR